MTAKGIILTAAVILIVVAGLLVIAIVIKRGKEKRRPVGRRRDGSQGEDAQREEGWSVKAKKVWAFSREIIYATLGWFGLVFILVRYGAPLWWKWYVVEHGTVFWLTTLFVCLVIPITYKNRDKLGKVLGWCLAAASAFIIGLNVWWIVLDKHPAYRWTEKKAGELAKKTEKPPEARQWIVEWKKLPSVRGNNPAIRNASFPARIEKMDQFEFKFTYTFQDEHQRYQTQYFVGEGAGRGNWKGNWWTSDDSPSRGSWELQQVNKDLFAGVLKCNDTEMSLFLRARN